MRAVAQRVRVAEVLVAGQRIASIGQGLCVYVAAGAGDGPADVQYLADKLMHLRVFSKPGEGSLERPAQEPGEGSLERPAGPPPGPPASARMTASVRDIGGAMLVVPQFTLYGDVRRGRRPDFSGAAAPDAGRQLLADLVGRLEGGGLVVAQGRFGADMVVRTDGDGPVTILLDSRRAF